MKILKTPRWKVIKKKSRRSAVINGNSKYSLQYIPGKKVFAPPNTLGIFVFTSEYEARKWVTAIQLHSWFYDYYTIKKKSLKIIKVFPIGRGVSPTRISRTPKSEDLKYFYNSDDGFFGGTERIPDGTLLYRGVYIPGGKNEN